MRKLLLRSLIFPALFLLLPLSLSAQFYPYYGKNKVQSGKRWMVYETDHYKIHYYTYNREMVAKTALYSENAFAKLSEFLGHVPESKIPIIIYQSHKEFEQTNLISDVLPEPIMGFTEPLLNRVVVPTELTDDTLEDLLTHELTHAFQNTILYGPNRTSLNLLSQPPLWTMEGFAEFMTGKWEPISTMVVRDSVVTGKIPLLTKEGDIAYTDGSSRSPYDFGHLVYDFLYKEYGRGGLRRFWDNMRQFSLVRNRNLLKNSFNLDYQIFNHKYQKYVRDLFKPYFGKAIPDDYALRVSPETPHSQIFGYSLSPSGDSAAIITVNYKNYSLSVSLIDLKTGKVYKDISTEYTSRYESLYLKFNPEEGRNLVWDRKGDFVSFIGRYNYDYYLLFYSSDGTFLRRKKLEGMNDPTGLDISPDNKNLVFSAIQNGDRDLFLYDLEKDLFTRLTSDSRPEFSPAFSPDGKRLIISEKEGSFYRLTLFSLLERRKIPLPQSAQSAITPSFKDEKTLLITFYDNQVYNLAQFDMESGKTQLLTDLATGAFYPQFQGGELYFLGYSQAEFSLFRCKPLSPLKTVEPLPPTELSPLVSTSTSTSTPWTFDPSKARPYKNFEDIVVSGLPNVGLGISTDGTTYGGAYLTFSDTLNNNEFNLLAYSLRSYRNVNLSYTNYSHRLPYSITFLNETIFYYYPTSYWVPDEYQNYYSYDDALATRKMTGAFLTLSYPIDRFRRLEFSQGFLHQKEDLYYYMYPGEKSPFFSGDSLPFSVALTGETTVFHNYGPYSGATYNITLMKDIPLTSSMRNTSSLMFDLRRYYALGYDTLFAFRAVGKFSKGDSPYLFYAGGDNEVRSAYYYSLVGNNLLFFNMEFRFPLVHLALTPLGILGPVRGVFFLDAGGAWLKGEDFSFMDWKDLRLKDSVGSIGYGIEFFLFGYPMHVEWTWRTDLEKNSNKEVKFWIGFDF